MPSHDLSNNEYAALSKLKAGSKVKVDVGFGCIEPQSTQIIQEIDGQLCIPCTHGYHFLEGQLDGDYLVGIYPA